MSVSCSQTTCPSFLNFSPRQESAVIDREWAKKRLDSLPPEGEEYRQLWNALHKTTGIATIQLPNGVSYKVSTQEGRLLGGFGASEHFFLGESVDLGGLGENIVLLVGDLPVRFGHILALAGDFYGVVNQPISLLGGSKKEKEGRFLAAFATLEQADPEQLKKLVWEAEAEYHDVKESAAPHHCYSSRLLTSNDRFQKIKGDVQELLIDNSDHFSENARDAYLIGHELACKEAAEAGCHNDQDRLKKAYAMEAFACHFLTDLFAAGHIRNQRGALEIVLHTQLGLPREWAKRLSAILTGAQHEYDGEKGLEVSTAKGGKWRAYGDGFFFTSKNKQNREKAIEALKESVDELAVAYRSKSLSPSQMASRFPEPGNNHDPLYKIEGEKLFIFKEGKKIPIETLKEYVLKAIPHAMTVLPESYVNGFINSIVCSLVGISSSESNDLENLLRTIIIPRLERLTGRMWNVVGLVSSSQLKSIDERNTALAKELMDTANASFQQGETILEEISRLHRKLAQTSFQAELDTLKRDIHTVRTSFSQLQSAKALNTHDLQELSTKLRKTAYSMVTIFSHVGEDAELFSKQSLLTAYIGAHLKDKSDEEKKLGATRWFRQILRYQVDAFSTYLKIKYREGDREHSSELEVRNFEGFLVRQVRQNQDFLIFEALFSTEAYVNLVEERIKMQQEFLKLIDV